MERYIQVQTQHYLATANHPPQLMVVKARSFIMTMKVRYWVGGMFWDGRASGWNLGDPLAEQAKGPFLNPVEQALPDAETLCYWVYYSKNAKLFRKAWGSLECGTTADVETVYDQIGYSISAYEKSAEVNPFNSNFDNFWDNAKAAEMDVTLINFNNWKDHTGMGLTDDEVFGLATLNDESKGKCSLCHTLKEGEAGYPLFTDFTYDNLGVPKNPEVLYTIMIQIL